MGIKIFVGLGNPGEKYKFTRHNIGFLALDFLAKKYNFSDWKQEKKFLGLIAIGSIKDQKIMLLKPQTFMNLSGDSVSALKNFYKLKTEDFLLFTDDIDLDLGVIRWREKGSSGGHNGLKDIIRVFGKKEFFRIKMGVSNTQKKIIPTENFVLQNFSDLEVSKLSSIFLDVDQKTQENFLKK